MLREYVSDLVYWVHKNSVARQKSSVYFFKYAESEYEGQEYAYTS